MASALLLDPHARDRSLRGNTDSGDSMVASGGESDGHPLRILVFLEASTIAGAVKPVLEFAREARESTGGRELSITMVSYVRARQQSSLLDVVRAQGIPLETIAERYPFDLRVIPQLRELAGRQRPDIIWTNNTKSHFLVSLAGLHRAAKWIAFHHGYTKEAWRTRLYNEVDRLSLPRADRVVTVCHAFAQQLQSKGVPADRIRVLRNPIRVPSPVSEAEKACLRTELGLDDASVLLSVGRLSREKGHADLLRAVERMRADEGEKFHSRLIIVGDGPERPRLQALSSELKLDDAVRFTGQQADVRAYYAVANVFVLPSHSEGSPNVLLEAMAAGVPMVATAVGGVPEVLSHEVNALLVPRQDVTQLANAIRRLLNDPLLRRQFADKGAEVVAQHNPQSYFQSVVGLFEEVMSEAPAT